MGGGARLVGMGEGVAMGWGRSHRAGRSRSAEVAKATHLGVRGGDFAREPLRATHMQRAHVQRTHVQRAHVRWEHVHVHVRREHVLVRWREHVRLGPRAHTRASCVWRVACGVWRARASASECTQARARLHGAWSGLVL
jgi:hypothetical protein